MKKLLITGGSGFIGTNMIEYYLKDGLEIINIDIVEPLNSKHNVYWKKCDINNYNELKNIFKNYKPTHVLHLAAGTGMNISNISHFKTNFDGVKNLINACNSVQSVNKVIFTSSLLVCERAYVPQHDEDFKPDSLYGESKVMSEKIVRESSLEAEWSIVRPTAVWGPWFRSSYTTFFNLVKKGWYVNPGKQKLEKPATYVGNTVYMIDKILQSNESHQQVYYLADYPEYSIQEWANTIAQTLGKKEPLTFSRFFIRSIAKIGDLIKIIFRNADPPLTTFRLNNIISGVRYDLDNTISVVGTLPHSLNDGVQITLDWMK